VEKIQRDLFRSDIHPSEARKEHIAAIAAALEAERLEEREECAKQASTTFMTMKGMGVQYFAGAEAASHNAAHAIRNRSTSE
jgi:hypothetical protein